MDIIQAKIKKIKQIMINVYLDPSIEEQIRQRIGDRQIFEINVNIYGITALYNEDGHCNFQEIEIDWDEMR